MVVPRSLGCARMLAMVSLAIAYSRVSDTCAFEKYLETIRRQKVTITGKGNGTRARSDLPSSGYSIKLAEDGLDTMRSARGCGSGPSPSRPYPGVGWPRDRGAPRGRGVLPFIVAGGRRKSPAISSTIN
jgi:hypothetical protein